MLANTAANRPGVTALSPLSGVSIVKTAAASKTTVSPFARTGMVWNNSGSIIVLRPSSSPAQTAREKFAALRQWVRS